MPRLGSASSSRSTVGQNVSLDHRNAGEGVGKDSGDQQSTDGCTEDYGLPTDCPHQNPNPLTLSPSLLGSRLRRTYQRTAKTCGGFPDAILSYHRL